MAEVFFISCLNPFSDVDDESASQRLKSRGRGPRFGMDLKLPGGQSHPAGKNRCCTWYADFPSVEAYEAGDGRSFFFYVLNCFYFLLSSC